MANDLVHLFNGLGVQGAHLVGISLGGMTAQGRSHFSRAVPEMFACPDCGMDVEIWTDEIKGKSTFCNKMFQKDKFVMPTMLFILIILNDQPLNIKEQRHWDGEMFAVISGLNVRLLRPADITKSIKKY